MNNTVRVSIAVMHVLSAISTPFSTVLIPQTIPSPGPGAFSHGSSGPTHVQSCANHTSGSQSSISCIWSVGATTAGHFIWWCIAAGTTVSSFTFTGETSSATPDPNLTNNGFAGYYTNCGWFVSSAGGSTTLTASASGLSYPSIVADEFSGLAGATVDAEDTPATCSSGSGCSTTIASNSISPGTNGDLAMGFTLGTQGYAITAGTNVAWTLGANTSGGGLYNEYYVQPTAASITAQFVSASGQNNLAHVVAFQ